jgi:hypothetical protein
MDLDSEPPSNRARTPEAPGQPTPAQTEVSVASSAPPEMSAASEDAGDKPRPAAADEEAQEASSAGGKAQQAEKAQAERRKKIEELRRIASGRPNRGMAAVEDVDDEVDEIEAITMDDDNASLGAAPPRAISPPRGVTSPLSPLSPSGEGVVGWGAQNLSKSVDSEGGLEAVEIVDGTGGGGEGGGGGGDLGASEDGKVEKFSLVDTSATRMPSGAGSSEDKESEEQIQSFHISDDEDYATLPPKDALSPSSTPAQPSTTESKRRRRRRREQQGDEEAVPSSSAKESQEAADPDDDSGSDFEAGTLGQVRFRVYVLRFKIRLRF